MSLPKLSPWVKTLISASVAGGFVAAAGGITDPAHFNLFDLESLKHLGELFVSGAFAGTVLYLRQSPFTPKWDGQDRRENP